MRSFLLFRLYGPLASWGEIAVGEVRPTALQPTRSALLGLLGAALGVRRGDDEAFSALGATLRFAVFVERAGVPARDYHTVQVAAPRRGRTSLTRADQLRERRHELGTILSYRDYRCDALYDIAAWHEGNPGAFPLERLEAALKRPVFTLYLGRKSCPLALPLGARVVEADNALAALASHPAPALKISGDRYHVFPDQLPGSPLGLFWEGDPGLGRDAAQSRTIRRDDPVSSSRRIFRTRTEDFQALDRHAPPEDWIHLSAEAISSRDLGEMLSSPYRLHKAVWSLFADHADRLRDFLYRLDWDSGRPLLWTLSDRPPRPVPELWDAQTRELNPILQPGERLRFSLRANPIVTREGKRHDVVMEAKRRLRVAGIPKADWPTEAQLAQEHGAAWLGRHAEGRGFAVQPGEILVDSYEVHTFQKPKGKEIRFATCDFHGLLTVTDADAFLHTLRHGVGPAKGFGCGLFLIRRAA